MPPYLNTDHQRSERGPVLLRRVLQTGLFTALAAGALLLSGCGKEEPEYYETETVQAPPAAQHAPPAPPAMPPVNATDQPATGETAFTFELPEGWSQVPASSMVIMAFEAGTPPEQVGSVQVSAFPGDVGGQLANLNRWRRQVGLGPVDPTAAAGFITDLEVSGIASWQVDLTGPDGMGPDGSAVRMVVTAVPHAGQTWFFKLMGPEGAVAAQKDSYGAFLQTVKF